MDGSAKRTEARKGRSSFFCAERKKERFYFVFFSFSLPSFEFPLLGSGIRDWGLNSLLSSFYSVHMCEDFSTSAEIRKAGRVKFETKKCAQYVRAFFYLSFESHAIGFRSLLKARRLLLPLLPPFLVSTRFYAADSPPLLLLPPFSLRGGKYSRVVTHSLEVSKARRRRDGRSRRKGVEKLK